MDDSEIIGFEEQEGNLGGKGTENCRVWKSTAPIGCGESLSLKSSVSAQLGNFCCIAEHQTSDCKDSTFGPEPEVELSSELPEPGLRWLCSGSLKR